MKRISSKQAKLNRERALWAAPWVQSVGRCMICNGTLWLRRADGQVITALHCHELLRGAYRQKCIEAGEILCLVACNLCHAGPLDDKAEMPLSRQIAYKVLWENPPMAISRIEEILAAVRAVKQNGRSPVVVEFKDVWSQIQAIRKAGVA